jgi:hypothetical protein
MVYLGLVVQRKWRWLSQDGGVASRVSPCVRHEFSKQIMVGELLGSHSDEYEDD